MSQRILGFCPQGNGDSVAPFDALFSHKKDISKSIADVAAVVFWGGTDIHPSLYGQKAHKHSQVYGDSPTTRDIFEWNAMKFCKTNNIPMIGVCRGAQLMCAFAGGRLIQDCGGHVGGSGGHLINTLDRDKGPTTFRATSCHHQMMYPFDVPHEMLAWSSTHQSDVYEDDKGAVSMAGKVEPEIVYFPEINGLAIQGHPEWAVGSTFADYCNDMVEKYLLVTEDI